MDELTKAAAAFRAAIEKTPAAKLPVTLQEFPHGACGDITLVLGHYLKTHGFGTFDYVFGMAKDEEGDRYSHAWLRQGRHQISQRISGAIGQAMLNMCDRFVNARARAY